MEFHQLTISQLNEGLTKKQFSAVELTNYFLTRIEKLNPDIFAFLTVTPQLALKQAQEVDELLAQGQEIPKLAGIPLAIKDNILVEGIRCTAASKILDNYIAPYDATVVKKLKERMAVFVGKTNLDEFAMGSSTENSAYGVTKNPYDLTRVAGGSSGGSAAAVAAGMCVGALGSDTGGSIRLPAAFCGIVGLKPTYGAVSRYGLIAMASSLDQIGPFGKTVEDAKIIFEAIVGKDELDSTSFYPLSDLPDSKNVDIKNIKIGIPKEYFVSGIEESVAQILKKAIKSLEEAGITLREISLPHTDKSLAVYYIIMPAEVSANLARYDGIKYGNSVVLEENLKEKANGLRDVYFKTRGEYFGTEVKRRIMLGTYALSAGYYDAYYLRAQKVRQLIRSDFEKAFKEVDLILTPTSPTLPFKIGERTDDPLKMYLSDIYTVSANLAGIPALTLPVGKVNNLPVGLQLMGPHFSESLLFQVGEFIEELTKES